MKSFKAQFVIALIAVASIVAVTSGCNNSDSQKAEDKVKDAATDTKDAVKDAANATHDTVTNAVGSMTATNK
jgi:hypothetical protein